MSGLSKKYPGVYIESVEPESTYISKPEKFSPEAINEAIKLLGSPSAKAIKALARFGVTAAEAGAALRSLTVDAKKFDEAVRKVSLATAESEEDVSDKISSMMIPSAKLVNVNQYVNSYEIKDSDICRNPLGVDDKIEEVKDMLVAGLEKYLEENDLCAVGKAKVEIDRHESACIHIVHAYQGCAEKDGLTDAEMEALESIDKYVSEKNIFIPDLVMPPKHPRCRCELSHDGDVTLDVGHGEIKICGTSDLKIFENKQKETETKSFDSVEDLRAWMRKGCPMTKGSENEK